MADTTETVQVAALVPATLAQSVKDMAQKSERSVGAEVRLALKAWVEADQGEDARRAS
jgi:hypothetical protein